MAKEFDAYIGRAETRSDVVSEAALARFKASLNMEAHSAHVPDGFHWCLGLPDHVTAGLGPDGHPPLGDFMPALPFPRRMWASSDVYFLAPLEVDMAVTRRTVISAIEPKSGKSGDLIFVTLDHVTSADGVDLIQETQTIVYRDHPHAATLLPPVEAAPVLGDWDWHETLMPDTKLLFRYSALTFNTHRIHYDQAYARDSELYPDLVVHGPLTATLLLKLCADNLGPHALTRFTFSARAPLFVDQPLHLAGRENNGELELCAFGGDGRVAVEAVAGLKINE